MSLREWPANDYAIGSYIQATVADNYLSRLNINPSDRVLDIGCGDGSYTRKVLAKVPTGSVLGLDASENMLHLARKVTSDYPNFSVQKGDVLNLDYSSLFDYIVSFWCLQWISDIHGAFVNIMNALKSGGKFLTLFPAGDDPYILGYYAVKESGQFANLINFKPPVDYSNLSNLTSKLEPIPCSQLRVELCQQSIMLPSLDVFRKFVNGIAFFQGQIPEQEIRQINEAIVRYFDNECKNKYNGEYQFNFTIYLITGEK